MSEEVPLSLAQKITKPIPLAALAVLVLAAVALAIIRAGGAQVGTIGYTLIAAVAIIALVAVALALAKSKPEGASIATKGDFSPGQVDGNYAVGVEAAKASGGTPHRVASQGTAGAATTISTDGSHSPGRVGGDYSVQNAAPKSEPRRK
jgi:hypothetical protein